MGSSGNFWGNLILQLRSEQQISQRQLAAGAKVNRSTLRRIEEGTARGDIEIMERLLNYLGYELEAMVSASVEERMKQRQAEAADPVQRSRLAAQILLRIGVGLLLMLDSIDCTILLLLPGV